MTSVLTRVDCCNKLCTNLTLARNVRLCCHGNEMWVQILEEHCVVSGNLCLCIDSLCVMWRGGGKLTVSVYVSVCVRVCCVCDVSHH